MYKLFETIFVLVYFICILQDVNSLESVLQGSDIDKTRSDNENGKKESPDARHININKHESNFKSHDNKISLYATASTNSTKNYFNGNIKEFRDTKINNQTADRKYSERNISIFNIHKANYDKRDKNSNINNDFYKQNTNNTFKQVETSVNVKRGKNTQKNIKRDTNLVSGKKGLNKRPVKSNKTRRIEGPDEIDYNVDGAPVMDGNNFPRDGGVERQFQTRKWGPRPSDLNQGGGFGGPNSEFQPGGNGFSPQNLGYPSWYIPPSNGNGYGEGRDGPPRMEGSGGGYGPPGNYGGQAFGPGDSLGNIYGSNNPEAGGFNPGGPIGEYYGRPGPGNLNGGGYGPPGGVGFEPPQQNFDKQGPGPPGSEGFRAELGRGGPPMENFGRQRPGEFGPPGDYGGQEPGPGINIGPPGPLGGPEQIGPGGYGGQNPEFAPPGGPNGGGFGPPGDYGGPGQIPMPGGFVQAPGGPGFGREGLGTGFGDYGESGPGPRGRLGSPGNPGGGFRVPRGPGDYDGPRLGPGGPSGDGGILRGPGGGGMPPRANSLPRPQPIPNDPSEFGAPKPDYEGEFDIKFEHPIKTDDLVPQLGQFAGFYTPEGSLHQNGNFRPDKPPRNAVSYRTRPYVPNPYPGNNPYKSGPNRDSRGPAGNFGYRGPNPQPAFQKETPPSRTSPVVTKPNVPAINVKKEPNGPQANYEAKPNYDLFKEDYDEVFASTTRKPLDIVSLPPSNMITTNDIIKLFGNTERPNDHIIEIIDAMKNMKGGYFTTFVYKAMEYLKDKNYTVLENLMSVFGKERQKMETQRSDTVNVFGDKFKNALLVLEKHLEKSDVQNIKDEIIDLYNTMKNLDEETKEMFRIIDTMYTQEEGDNIIYLLYLIKNYPKTNFTANQIVSKVMDEVMMNPISKLKDTVNQKMLVDVTTRLINKIMPKQLLETDKSLRRKVLRKLFGDANDIPMIATVKRRFRPKAIKEYHKDTIMQNDDINDDSNSDRSDGIKHSKKKIYKAQIKHLKNKHPKIYYKYVKHREFHKKRHHEYKEKHHNKHSHKNNFREDNDRKKKGKHNQKKQKSHKNSYRRSGGDINISEDLNDLIRHVDSSTSFESCSCEQQVLPFTMIPYFKTTKGMFEILSLEIGDPPNQNISIFRENEGTYHKCPISDETTEAIERKNQGDVAISAKNLIKPTKSYKERQTGTPEAEAKERASDPVNHFGRSDSSESFWKNIKVQLDEVSDFIRKHKIPEPFDTKKPQTLVKLKDIRSSSEVKHKVQLKSVERNVRDFSEEVDKKIKKQIKNIKPIPSHKQRQNHHHYNKNKIDRDQSLTNKKKQTKQVQSQLKKKLRHIQHRPQDFSRLRQNYGQVGADNETLKLKKSISKTILRQENFKDGKKSSNPSTMNEIEGRTHEIVTPHVTKLPLRHKDIYEPEPTVYKTVAPDDTTTAPNGFWKTKFAFTKKNIYVEEPVGDKQQQVKDDFTTKKLQKELKYIKFDNNTKFEGFDDDEPETKIHQEIKNRDRYTTKTTKFAKIEELDKSREYKPKKYREHSLYTTRSSIETSNEHVDAKPHKSKNPSRGRQYKENVQTKNHDIRDDSEHKMNDFRIPAFIKNIYKADKILGRERDKEFLMTKRYYFQCTKANFKDDSYKYDQIYTFRRHHNKTNNFPSIKHSKAKSTMLKKITELSSYSDEEPGLKKKLNDALAGKKNKFNLRSLFRRKNNEINKISLTDPASSTDEEHILKSNIYKSFGFDSKFKKVKKENPIENVVKKSILTKLVSDFVQKEKQLLKRSVTANGT